MRILIVTPAYYPHIGGVEYVVKSVAERLARMGHDVTVIAGEPNTEVPREEEVNSVKILRWPTWSPGGAYHFPKRITDFEKLLKGLLREADVVHIHSIHAVFSVYALRAVRGENVRIVVTPYYHGTGHTPVRRFLWVFWRKYANGLIKDCTVHTVSRLEAELIERDFSARAIVIENGVEEWVRNLEWEPRDYVMYSGRIEKYKNVDVLAKIVKILNERYGLSLELKIFGRGPYRERLIRVLKSLGVQYELGDFEPYEEYVRTLSHATLFALLSERESYPQSVNEANAIGVPVVVAKPWGLNFEGRKRTLIVSLSEDLNTLAESIYEFMKRAHLEEKSHVPTWDEAAYEYLKRLYSV